MGDVCARLLPAAFAKLVAAMSGAAATNDASTRTNRRIADTSEGFDARVTGFTLSHNLGRNCVCAVTAIAAGHLHGVHCVRRRSRPDTIQLMRISLRQVGNYTEFTRLLIVSAVTAWALQDAVGFLDPRKETTINNQAETSIIRVLLELGRRPAEEPRLMLRRAASNETSVMHARDRTEGSPDRTKAAQKVGTRRPGSWNGRRARRQAI